ncbi:MAG TPA: ABC transporter permease [Anaerolineales bacterium]|nr:ABC transporter permease [Anaerolineales bacterium]
MTTTTVSDNRFSRGLRGFRIPPVFVFLIIVFLVGGVLDQLFSDGQIFTNPAIMLNIIVRSVALGIVAVGQTLVILGASIDLSVAYTISITAVMSSYIMQGDPTKVPLALLGVFGIGAAIGLVNGLVITKLHVNSFIATLGTSLIIAGIINATFSNYTGSVPREFEYFGYGTIGPVPVSIIVLAVMFIGGWLLLSRTKFGSHLYGVGGNAEVSRLSGLRTDRVLIGAHVLCSLTAVLAGVFLVSQMRSGAPWVGPNGVYDLNSIAVTVIGGTALSGGKGGVWGTLAGVLIFGVLDTVFNQLGVNPYLKIVLQGAIVVLAVASYTFRSKEEPA